MKLRIGIFLLFVLLISIFSIFSLVYSVSFTSTSTPTAVDLSTTNQLFNFTVSNINTTGNITQVNITLPSGFIFINSSNATTASNTSFSNTTTILSWGNTTSTGFVANGTSQYFWFNVSVPSTVGYFNFNISTVDTSNNFNSTLVQIAVNPSVWSPNKQFGITPDILYLNWTNNYTSNITLTINETFNNISLKILNDTSIAVANYSQSNSQTKCQSGSSGYRLYVINASGQRNNVIGPLDGTNSTNATIIDNIVFNHLTCAPGLYRIEEFTIRNTTQTNESANITILIDIPISSSNNANILTTGMGSFSGTLPTNATEYHSYYFNTSLIENATSVAINLTGWASSQDVDLFLFDDSGNFRAKSINKTATNEWLIYKYLPLTPAMWEIRVYGNTTNSSGIPYTGYIIFSTLNITNTSNTAQQISSLDFGVMNASSTKRINITLINEGSLNLTNVVESKELYHINRFSESGTQNFTFLVPNSTIASKVKVSLNWTGASNYSFNLYNQDDTLLVNSMNKYSYANKTGAMQEEYNETTSIGSTAGIWKIEVKNNTATTDSYTVTGYTYVSASSWVATNYTTMTFNRSENYATDVTINFTVQNNTLDGIYEGYLQYLDGNKAGVKISISVNVTTPMLVVNNTLNSLTTRIDENNGTALTRFFTFVVNNTGFYDMTVTLTDSSNLTCISGCSGFTANLSYDTITSISSYSSQTLSGNVTFNNSIPTGLYEGWIFINATNETLALSPHPAPNFNITLRLNLTSLLDVRVSGIVATSESTTRNSSAENVTAELKIYYINGTEVEAKEAMTTSNFSVWLVEGNTSYRIPSTNYLDLYNGTNPIYISPSYSINFTVPANIPGGIYEVHADANYKRNPSFSGEGVNKTLVINNTGLYMVGMNSTTLSINNGTTYDFCINVSNYGPIAASSATINFTESCSGWDISTSGYRSTSSCNAGTFDTTKKQFPISPPAHNTSCAVCWKITAGSSAASACTGNIMGDSTTNKWFNPSGVNVSVTVNCPYCNVTTDGTPTDGTTTTPTPTGEAAKYLNITDYTPLIIVKQGGSNSTKVTVKNINTTKSQDLKLSIDNINSSWVSVSPTLTKVTPLNSVNFTVTFNAPSDAEIKDYNGKFIAIGNYVNVSQEFTLRVLPSETKEAEINQSIVLFKLNMTELEKEINQSKRQGYNVSIAESKLLELKLTIEQAENYVEQGDYFSAYQLFDSIQTLIDEIKTELEKVREVVKKGFELKFEWQQWMTWVVVAVGAGAGVFLAYLFWPTRPKRKTFAPKPPSKFKKFLKKPKEDTWSQLKEKWSKIKKEKKKET